MGRGPVETKVEYTISGYDDLAEVHSRTACEPKQLFENTVQQQLLKIRISRGDRQAADEFLALLHYRILHGSVSAVDMIEVADILGKAIVENLASRLLGYGRRGRNKRSAITCLEICMRVREVSAERDIPIRGSTQPGVDDALTVVAEERRQKRLKPWIHATVKKYYDEGMPLYKEARHGALQSIKDAVEFFDPLQTEDTKQA